MKSILVAVVFVFTAAVSTSGTASAQFPGGYGMFPFGGYGFYSPYGSHYGTTLRTPPYFATNPPVYYGARHTRPYGISPFAAPPMVNAPANYRSRLDTDSVAPPPSLGAPMWNPCVTYSQSVKPAANAKGVVTKGPVRENPYFTNNDDADKLAKK